MEQKTKSRNHLSHRISIFSVFQYHLPILSVIPSRGSLRWGRSHLGHPPADILETHYMDSLTPRIQGEMRFLNAKHLQHTKEGSEP